MKDQEGWERGATNRSDEKDKDGLTDLTGSEIERWLRRGAAARWVCGLCMCVRVYQGGRAVSWLHCGQACEECGTRNEGWVDESLKLCDGPSCLLPSCNLLKSIHPAMLVVSSPVALSSSPRHHAQLFLSLPIPSAYTPLVHPRPTLSPFWSTEGEKKQTDLLVPLFFALSPFPSFAPPSFSLILAYTTSQTPSNPSRSKHFY